MFIRQTVTGKALFIPVSHTAPELPVRLSAGEEFCLLNIPAVPRPEADFIAAYHLPFQTAELTIEADERFFHCLLDRKPAEEAVPVRAAGRFTPAFGWLNDPNGLFFADGVWHLFFQHNPLSINWGNMHWGHAVSRDLIHWQELELALYPDSRGTIYSGSAVIDKENVSALGAGTILLYYTNAGYNGNYSQNIAFSTDGGAHFQTYAGNPVVPNFTGDCDRDPFVAFDPDAQCWRMGLYLGDEERCEFAFLKSTDLLNWQETDRYTIDGGRECPCFFRSQDSATGCWKWIFTEANGFYRIGAIRNDRIIFETDSERFLTGDAYAGQFFHNAPEGKAVFIAWLRGEPTPDLMSNGSMTTPLELTLHAGKVQLSPYVRQSELRPVTINEHQPLQTPYGELRLDRSTHQIRYGTRSWPIPAQLQELNGKMLVDETALEYFDNSGSLTFILALQKGVSK